jgi:hypothetical protein
MTDATTPTAYAVARDALVAHLREDAAAHEAERFDAIGRRFDAVERRFPRGTDPELDRLHVALAFWDGWIDARNHGWPAGPIARAAWPEFARGVASDLEADRDIVAPVVRARFDLVAHPRLTERVQQLAARLRPGRAPW